MKKVRMTAVANAPPNGRGTEIGALKPGEVHEFDDDFAIALLYQGVAEEIVDPEPAPDTEPDDGSGEDAGSGEDDEEGEDDDETGQ